MTHVVAPSLRPFYVGNNTITTVVEPPNTKITNKKHLNDTLDVIAAPQTKEINELMKQIEAFFSKPEHMGKLLPLLEGKSRISLRFIEWFVTVYAAKKTIDWFVNDEHFILYNDYQNKMHHNKKLRFDPFGRKWRKENKKIKGNMKQVRVYYGIHFYINDTDFIETTVAQLNFFKWFIEKQVLEYIIDNYDTLAKEMNKYNQEKKQQKLEDNDSSSKKDKRRNNSTKRKVRIKAAKRVTKRNVEVYVSFD
jgi:hypothetical protein